MHAPSFSCSPLHLDTIYTPLDSERERTLKMRTPREVLPLLSLLLPRFLLLLLLLHYALSKVAVAFWRSFFCPLGRLQTQERVSKSFGHIPAHASTLKLHLIINCVRARERERETALEWMSVFAFVVVWLRQTAGSFLIGWEDKVSLDWH